MLGSVITAAVTPFRADGAVDLERFRELATFLVENGSDGLVVCGTTGESPTLTDDEKLDLFRTAVDAIGDRATVIAGTGTYDTGHSAALTREATELGVDAILVVTPYYNKPPQRAILRHFEEIAGATHLPVVAYNIPSRVVVNIESATIARLAQALAFPGAPPCTLASPTSPSTPARWKRPSGPTTTRSFPPPRCRTASSAPC